MPKKFSFSHLVCFLSALLLVALGVLSFWPSSDFSESENRYLASLPTPSAESVLSGALAEEFSAYLGDHIPLRLSLLRLRSLLAFATGRQECGGVLFGKHGYLIKRLTVKDSLWDQNLAAAAALKNILSAAHVPTVCVVAPRVIDVMTKECPPTFASESPTLPDGFLSPVALLQRKAEEGEAVYFRTDHHWTPRGAYEGYRWLGEAMGYTPYDLCDFTPELLSDSFLGSSAASVQFPLAVPDHITALRYEGDDTFAVTDLMTGAQAKGFYRREKLNTQDQYAVYLGGNFAHLRIEGTSPRPRLLLIKDSFANCLVPFLARHYDIDLVDLRYVRGDRAAFLQDLLTKNTFDAALLLWNTETLSTDPSLLSFLPEEY